MYFALEADLRFVTDAYLYTRESQDRVVRFAKSARKAIEALQIAIPATAEIYLLPYDDEECGYYIVDHATHIVSWLEVVDLDQLCIPDVVSDSHLRKCKPNILAQMSAHTAICRVCARRTLLAAHRAVPFASPPMPLSSRGRSHRHLCPRGRGPLDVLELDVPLRRQGMQALHPGPRGGEATSRSSAFRMHCGPAMERRL